MTLPFEEAFRAKDWENALKIAERIPAQDRGNARMLLMEARCHQQLGKFSNAQRAAARVRMHAKGTCGVRTRARSQSGTVPFAGVYRAPDFTSM